MGKGKKKKKKKKAKAAERRKGSVARVGPDAYARPMTTQERKAANDSYLSGFGCECRETTPCRALANAEKYGGGCG